VVGRPCQRSGGLDGKASAFAAVGSEIKARAHGDYLHQELNLSNVRAGVGASLWRTHRDDGLVVTSGRRWLFAAVSDQVSVGGLRSPMRRIAIGRDRPCELASDHRRLHHQATKKTPVSITRAVRHLSLTLFSHRVIDARSYGRNKSLVLL